MNFLKIIGVGLITVFASLLTKQINNEFSMLINLAGGIIIIFMIVDLLDDVFYTFENLINISGIDVELFKILFKVVGIGYVTEFSSDICLDSGNQSVANKILFAGKIIIFIISIPIINSLVSTISSLL